MTISETEFNTVVKGIQEIRSDFEDARKKDAAETKEKEDRILKEIGDLQEKANEKFLQEEAARKELESKLKNIEKAASRIGGGDDLESKETAKRYNKAMERYLRKGVEDFAELEDLVGDVKSVDPLLATEIKTMVAGSNPDGGYLVLPEFGGIKEGQKFETSPMRAISDIVTISSDMYEFVLDDDEAGAASWVGEVTAPSTTGTPSIHKISIAAHELQAEPKVTQKLLDDGIVNIEQWLQRKVDEKFTRQENTAFVSGDGSQKPKGFLSYSNWTSPGVYQRNAVEQIASGSAGAVTADGIYDLNHSLKEFYQAGALYLMQRATWGDVTKLKDGSGAYLLNWESLREGDGMLLQGKRVLFADDMQAVGADALAIAYGNFGMGYTIVDRIGLRVLRDPYSDKPFIKFYTTKRVGGAVTNYEAIKIQKLATSV